MKQLVVLYTPKNIWFSADSGVTWQPLGEREHLLFRSSREGLETSIDKGATWRMHHPMNNPFRLVIANES